MRPPRRHYRWSLYFKISRCPLRAESCRWAPIRANCGQGRRCQAGENRYCQKAPNELFHLFPPLCSLRTFRLPPLPFNYICVIKGEGVSITEGNCPPNFLKCLNEKSPVEQGLKLRLKTRQTGLKPEKEVVFRNALFRRQTI